MTAPSHSLASRAEAAIRRLRDVEGVSVHAVGDEIREIHVVTRSERPPKQIVRDVQTVLRTGLGVGIDHRVVSVALAGPPSGEDDLGGEDAEAAAEGQETGRGRMSIAEEPAVQEDRIRFESVNLFVSGPRTQAQVELRWRGMPRIGSATGFTTRDESHRLVAQAAATSVQEFLADPVALSVQGIDFVEVGKRRAVLVALSMLAHRQEKILTGSCIVEQDTPQAVVLATLDALNRVIGGLRVKEPVEYVLRPVKN